MRICLVIAVLCLLQPEILLKASEMEWDKCQLYRSGFSKADEDDAAFLDTFDNYLRLDPQKRKTFYADTVHQNDSGQRYIGQLMFDEIIKLFKERG